MLCIVIYNNLQDDQTMSLTGILVLAVVLAALGPLQCEAATEYYVRPVSDTSCPGEPCLTWTEYVSHSDQYFHSNTTFWFMPGTHHMNVTLKASNFSNVALIGFRDKPEVVGNISCTCVNKSCGCAGFMFSNATNITLKMLSLTIQLRNGSSTFEISGLSLYNISPLHITNCSVRLMAAYKYYSPSVMNISSSTHVELAYVHVSNTKGRGIYFLNTTHGSITDLIVDSRARGIYLSECCAISVRRPLFKGKLGITMTNTINSSITDAVFLKTRQSAINLFKVTNITVSNANIISSQKLSSIIKIEKSKNVSVNNVTAANWYLAIRVNRCQNITLSFIQFTGYGLYAIDFSSSINITLHDCHFINFNSPRHTTDILTQPAIIEMNNNSGVTFRDSSFKRNSISCLKLVNTHFTVNGTLTFENNRVYRGAALIFIDKSSLTISDESTLVFKNNNAATTGGAIYVVSSNYNVRCEDGLQSCLHCFLKVEDKSKTARLIFKNNTASQGGDVLYGGSLGRACTYTNKRCNSCLQVFRNVSEISPKTLSTITSDPSRACFCINGSLDCFLLFHSSFTRYSGQKITISAFVVGQDFGTVAGLVYAHFLPEKEKDSSVTLEEKEVTQEVQKHRCNTLNYTILSHSQTIKKVVLILTAVNKHETQLIQPEEMDSAKSKYDKYKNGSIFPQDLLNFPIYINITILLCPPGFSSTPEYPRCHCNEQLQQLPGISCDIRTQTISRAGQMWVGSETDINNTVIITSSQCPLPYCKKEKVDVSLSQPDSQCRYNRSGILCGACQPGLSLALGSTQCLECSNTYLTLLIPFALAGIVLVFFIKFLDLTIAQGFINGFIFYANIIKANEHLLVPDGPNNPLTLFISWLNLDLGIETCFFDGLNAFTKTLLQLVFPLYVWFTVWVIIMSSRYSHKVARVFGRNSVPVLATLFLLSYAKLIQLIVTALSYTFVEFPHGKTKTVWSADGNIDYLENPHLVLFLAAVAILLFLWLPYTFLILSAQWLQKYNVYIITTILNRIKPFLDAHYGPLKDKHHYWFGVLLLTRVAILLLSELIPSHNFGIVILSIVTASFLLTGFSFTGQYRNILVSVYELSLFINLGLLATVQYQTHITQENRTILAYFLIGVAFLQFIALILFRAYCSLNPWIKIHFRKHRTLSTSSNVGENDNGDWRYNNTIELREVSAQHPLISNSESSEGRDTTSYMKYAEGEDT